MRKNIIVIIITLISISSCSQNNEENKTTNTNMLLAQEVLVSCVAVVDNQDTPEWTKGFNSRVFFKTVNKKAISGEPSVYGDAALHDTINIKVLATDVVEERIKSHIDTLYSDFIKEIRFLEKWGFDRNTLKFTKDITAWVPIKSWTENDKTRKMQTFYIYPKNQAKGILVAESIFYNHPWFQEYPNLYTGFDQQNFLKQIIDGIKSGNIAAYDPIYMVDKSKRKFTLEQLEKYINHKLEPINLDFQMYSILFEEDWYFDENTLGIIKDVKSIAFVAYNPEINSEPSKKILFFIFPK